MCSLSPCQGSWSRDVGTSTLSGFLIKGNVLSACQWFLIRAVGLLVALSVVPDQGTCGFDLCRTAGDNGVIPSGNPRARTLSTQIPLHVDCRCCGCQTRTSSRVRSGVGGLPPYKVRNATSAPLPVWIITLAVLFCVARQLKGPCSRDGNGGIAPLAHAHCTTR